MNQFGKMMKIPRIGTGMKVTPFVLPFPPTFIGDKKEREKDNDIVVQKVTL